jgi:hypothetical protein
MSKATLVSLFLRFADVCDRLTSFTAYPAHSGLNLPHDLVSSALGPQMVIGRQRSDSLLGLALYLIDRPFALVLVEHLPPDIVSSRSIRLSYANVRRPLNGPDDEQHDCETNSTCANAPIVYVATMPNNQAISTMTAMVHSMGSLSLWMRVHVTPPTSGAAIHIPRTQHALSVSRVCAFPHRAHGGPAGSL